MAIWDRFKKEKQDPVIEKVDPIVEQRRKEKFSTPLIYNDEEKFEEKEKARVAVKQPRPQQRSPIKKRVKVENTYQMSEVISPFFGKKEETRKAKPKSETPKRVVKKPIEDQLVPVISPIYGAQVTLADEEEQEIEEKVTKEETIFKKRSAIKKDNMEVNENLRRLSSQLNDEDLGMTLVQKETGEFQFDFSKSMEFPSIADEIDDAMTLDELMSLYEKKFRDGEEE